MQLRNTWTPETGLPIRMTLEHATAESCCPLYIRNLCLHKPMGPSSWTHNDRDVLRWSRLAHWLQSLVFFIPAPPSLTAKGERPEPICNEFLHAACQQNVRKSGGPWQSPPKHRSIQMQLGLLCRWQCSGGMPGFVQRSARGYWWIKRWTNSMFGTANKKQIQTKIDQLIWKRSFTKQQ